jgi:hypothetical protein
MLKGLYKWVESLLKVSSACLKTAVNPREESHIPLGQTRSSGEDNYRRRETVIEYILAPNVGL